MFFMVSGRKTQEKGLGYAADFCPVCRDLQPFAIDRINVTRHINGVSLGEGQTVGFQEICQTCGFGSGVDPSRFQTMVRRLPESLEALIGETYPDIRVDCAQRLFLEDDVRRASHRIDADLRRELVREPFLLLKNQTAYQRPIQATPLTACALVLGLVGPLVILFLRLPDAIADPLACLLFFGGMGIVLWRTVVDAFARRSREPRPLLLRALRPLQPTEDELALVLGNLMIRSLSVWKGLTPARLLAQMDAAERAELAAREKAAPLTQSRT